ncbi:hypothetical protein HWV62_42749 [Athelia sp. TMB]|nr:hypothetical protein HWV62_42749 [Athelia sp. TMB]
MPASSNNSKPKSAPTKAPAKGKAAPKPKSSAALAGKPTSTADTSRRTRSNAQTSKPDADVDGEPVVDASKPKRKRRTKEQIAADDRAIAEAAAAKSAQRHASLQKVADMEQILRREDNNLVTPRAAPPSVRSVTAKSSALDLEDSASELTEPLDSDGEPWSEFQEEQIAVPVPVVPKRKPAPPPMEDSEEGEDFDINGEDTPIVKKVKTKQQGARVTINGMRHAADADLDQKSVKQLAPKEDSSKLVSIFSSPIHMLTLDETTLFYFSLACESSAPKYQTGAIARWVATSAPSSRSQGRSNSRTSKAISISTASKSSSASRRVVAPSALTNDITISANAPVKTESEDTLDFDTGGLSDVDETHGPEHDAAAASPVKGKSRKDSEPDIIEIDDTPVPKRIQKKENGVKTTNNDLPIGCLDEGKWLKVFIPTVVYFLSSQENPWSIADRIMKKALQAIFNTVYKGKVEHEVVAGDSVWCVSNQRLAEFRSKMGSAGLAIINSLLDSEKGCRIPIEKQLFDTDEKRIKVPALKDLAGSHAFGAIGLSTASVRRALSLWADSAITISIWEDAKANNRGDVLNKNFLKTVSGIDNTSTKLKFDEIGFGEDTANYAEDAADLTTKELDDIIASAKELARRARGSRSSRLTASTTENDRPIKRRRLGNVNDDDACKLLYFICIVVTNGLIMYLMLPYRMDIAFGCTKALAMI